MNVDAGELFLRVGEEELDSAVVNHVAVFGEQGAGDLVETANGYGDVAAFCLVTRVDLDDRCFLVAKDAGEYTGIDKVGSSSRKAFFVPSGKVISAGRRSLALSTATTKYSPGRSDSTLNWPWLSVAVSGIFLLKVGSVVLRIEAKNSDADVDRW
jgi:hypothetical protein